MIAFRPDEKQLNDDTPEYVSIWSQAHSEVRWLRIMTVLLFIVLSASAWAAWEGWSRPPEFIYVRVDETGRAAVVPGVTFSNQPDESNIKYFLTRFVHLHYSRRKATLANDLPTSLYFLDNPLADRLRYEWQQQDVVGKAMQQPHDLEVEITNIALRETQTKPYQAEVDYILKTVDPSSRQVLGKRTFTATIHYIVNQQVPNSIIQYNPIGLNIVYFREDESFVTEKQ